MSSTHLLKGSLQVIILRLLETNGRMYGYEITKTVKEMSKGEFQITEGALYPALHKLEAEGLVETTIELVDGRARKYYSLSKQGQTEAKTKLSDVFEFWRNLQLVLNPKPI
jgi:PadR family transcriptional regulator PadR